MSIKRTSYWFDTTSYNKHLSDSVKKITILEEIIAYIKPYIAITSIKQLSSNPYEYIKEAISKKHSKTFENIDFIRLCELIGIDNNHLKKITTQYQAMTIDIDVIKMKPKEVDFNLYAVGEEQHERLDLCNRIIELYDHQKNIIPHTNPHKVVSASCGAVLIDWSNATNLRVNPYFINEINL